ncbi:MAG: NAD(P)/FAD-dependent oxidoreductase [Dehalococcoidia bacterium]|nr:NAD(P)/FAD-dependent oxidoreductase [Dehalococcoidia bacterium]
MKYDAIIIGAGMSGLAAGIRLAYYDKKVCILERHHRVGGLNSFYVRDGHKFDVGLHAMTNYVPANVKSTPLPKLLRQLKLKAEDFALCQQNMSAIRFPGRTLRFNNNLDFFVQEVVDNFPREADNFQRLLRTISEYNAFDLYAKPASTREVLRSIIKNAVLIDMLLCPLMYYGNAQEDDMEFGQFVIMFNSIFCEGFARPEAGVRKILEVLLRKFRDCGGELRLKSGVRRLRVLDNKVDAVILESGEILKADNIISSAGYIETLKMLSNFNEEAFQVNPGRLSFVEFILILDKELADIGYDTTITFFNSSNKFSYHKPRKLVDISSGVICCPNNFQYDKRLPEAMIRLTNMANYELWARLSPEEYGTQKAHWLASSLEEVVKCVPDFRDSIIYSDIFTPKTIYRFTGHLGGAVYGTPDKVKTGKTHLENLFICGTDQGFLGIVGAMLSGISMANLHILQKGL